MIDIERLEAAYLRVREDLLAERTAAGHWVGELSTSALSTATAVSALAAVRRSPAKEKTTELDQLIAGGLRWLAVHQNADGGFGDTDKSHSNIATTMLVVAAFHLAEQQAAECELLARANAYIDAQGRLAGLRARYGKDKTFVVPIMTNCALAGLCDWNEIDPLPFELACVPQAWYRFVGMPVVSYAIPALVAIGQAIYFHRKPGNPLARAVRAVSIEPSLRVLRTMQPDSGGYLEATPLTSFVVMSLASIGRADHAVTQAGIQFLSDSVRPDGSWPIDTNLATWVTTLSINALAAGGENVAELLGPECFDWLLACQHPKRHPFTGAEPGGFGWSDLSGAVPDADDTPGAMLALDCLRQSSRAAGDDSRIASSVRKATQWLLKLQNRDGGWPTFCRGWGSLPFDRSGTDLTAHALRALAAWQAGAVVAMKTGLAFLKSRQNTDGSWSPLWFGNQDHPTEDNPIYGTAKVLLAYRDLGLIKSPPAQRGLHWLHDQQNPDSGWGGSYLPSSFSPQSPAPSPQSRSANPGCRSSIEETALAVEALLADANNPAFRSSIESGTNWLIAQVGGNKGRECSPIGFYFAKLWYYEKLYPLVFTLSALGHARRHYSPPRR
jgi:squalene-hopene/tetraprenyl-beta-curcumene cyclase